ncbi:unnamed protein product [Caenorhabditis auriculariae]|uniref:Secreted protein n=1 Tax=Caenorhabditis auriculariae TaxID=2777116 RepID=A0A8S1HCF0_9PELO|nr:unnamed protein product [Caenorhabditis auriculariae]
MVKRIAVVFLLSNANLGNAIQTSIFTSTIALSCERLYHLHIPLLNLIRLRQQMGFPRGKREAEIIRHERTIGYGPVVPSPGVIINRARREAQENNEKKESLHSGISRLIRSPFRRWGPIH